MCAILSLSLLGVGPILLPHNMAPTSRWLGPALNALTEAASRPPPLGLMEPLDLSLGGGQAINGKFSMSLLHFP